MRFDSLPFDFRGGVYFPAGPMNIVTAASHLPFSNLRILCSFEAVGNCAVAAVAVPKTNAKLVAAVQIFIELPFSRLVLFIAADAAVSKLSFFVGECSANFIQFGQHAEADLFFVSFFSFLFSTFHFFGQGLKFWLPKSAKRCQPLIDVLQAPGIE